VNKCAVTYLVVLTGFAILTGVNGAAIDPLFPVVAIGIGYPLVLVADAIRSLKL
jgi:hypothetical protein